MLRRSSPIDLLGGGGPPTSIESHELIHPQARWQCPGMSPMEGAVSCIWVWIMSSPVAQGLALWGVFDGL